MPSLKQFRQLDKNAAQQQRVIAELNDLAKDIERCEKTISTLQAELISITAKQPEKRTTREDIDYLTALLKCANKKLVWEKNISSLQKRLPVVLEKMSTLIDQPQAAGDDHLRTDMLRALQVVQAAMERLQNAKVQ